jgi:hypothetical protein
MKARTAALIDRYPECRVWLEAGIPIVPARALVVAGIRDLEDLAVLTRSEFLAIPGVGAGVLRHCERRLGRPLAAPPPEPKTVDLDRDRDVILTRPQWRSLGFGAKAAVELTARRLSLKALARLDRRELLTIPGIGETTLPLCEKLTGRSLSPEPPDPAVVEWCRLGLRPCAARSLVDAGIRSIADLQGKSRADFKEVRFIGASALGLLEEAAGFRLPRRPRQAGGANSVETLSYWAARGLSARAGFALVRAGIRDLAALSGLTREKFLLIDGLGANALQQCEALLGAPLPSSLKAWAAMGAGRALASRLSLLGINSLEDLAEKSYEELRKLGFSWKLLAQLETLLERTRNRR